MNQKNYQYQARREVGELNTWLQTINFKIGILNRSLANSINLKIQEITIEYKTRSIPPKMYLSFLKLYRKKIYHVILQKLFEIYYTRDSKFFIQHKINLINLLSQRLGVLSSDIDFVQISKEVSVSTIIEVLKDEPIKFACQYILNLVELLLINPQNRIETYEASIWIDKNQSNLPTKKDLETNFRLYFRRYNYQILIEKNLALTFNNFRNKIMDRLSLHACIVQQKKYLLEERYRRRKKKSFPDLNPLRFLTKTSFPTN